MEEWKITKFVLLNGVDKYNEYIDLIHRMRRLKNYWKIDYSKLDAEALKNMYHKVRTCFHEALYLTRLTKGALACNTFTIDCEYHRINQEYNRRNRTTREGVSKVEIRREIAKKHRSCGKSKNR